MRVAAAWLTLSFLIAPTVADIPSGYCCCSHSEDGPEAYEVTLMAACNDLEMGTCLSAADAIIHCPENIEEAVIVIQTARAPQSK